ncbi:hypothetical protein L6164_002356 [Bauhinia variegata]|uniref:Uncharacterized protein n=1 Tax=Bauhinia variegata TaxID=167791 RepID=A0ACB9PY44_BAUVA|nr:hypothetical protein L6164_002356 [Bauhinia variegata]
MTNKEEGQKLLAAYSIGKCRQSQRLGPQFLIGFQWVRADQEKEKACSVGVLPLKSKQMFCSCRSTVLTAAHMMTHKFLESQK